MILKKLFTKLFHRTPVKTETEEYEEYLQAGTERLIDEISMSGKSAIKFYLRETGLMGTVQEGQ